MNRRCVFLKCNQCGAQFSATFGRGASRNTLPQECPVCHAGVGLANLSHMGAAPYRGDFRAELEVLLCEARNRGVTSAEIMQALQEELQFESDLAGRVVAVKLIELGPGAQSSTRRSAREWSDAAPPRPSAA
ncbi:MAG: hypothetical protein U0641_11475 [Anaerolineae bacterium]